MNRDPIGERISENSRLGTDPEAVPESHSWGSSGPARPGLREPELPKVLN